MLLTLAAAVLLLAGCGSVPRPAPLPASYLRVGDPSKADDVVVYALGLIDTGYRYGGTSPEGGLDCSGMVSHVYERVAGLRLPHSAARIAWNTRPVERDALRPGDLVFFNTLDRAFSHVGIYIGDGRFVHAPSGNGRVRVSRLDQPYFAQRFEAARTLFAD